MNHVIQHPDGSYQHLSDFCDTGPTGSGLAYVSTALTHNDEILGIELGLRVLNSMLETALTGWSPFWDAHLDEYLSTHPDVNPGTPRGYIDTFEFDLTLED